MNKVNHPIDILITWVDGADPAWLAEKQKYKAGHGADDRVARYRDWDNLQYIFRGIEKFAPWVRNVFLVTWGHLPGWLNTKHPQLKIVTHRDFIPPEYLPTFSSHAIELNFHRINRLSEHFVYFNDDTFLLKETAATDFFKDGRPCDSAVLNAHSHDEGRWSLLCEYRAAGIVNKYFKIKDVIAANPDGWFSPLYGDMNRISKVLAEFPRLTGIWQHHLPASILKSTMVELWEKEGANFDWTCQHKFRTVGDFNQWVFRNWQLASNYFEPRSVDFGRRFETDDENYLARVKDYIEKQQGHMICINDSDPVMGHDEFVAARDAINGSFERILPEKAVYEVTK